MKMSKQYNGFEADGMGFFMDYLRRWWKPNPIARRKLRNKVRRFLRGLVEKGGVSRVHFFLWAHDNKKNTTGLYWDVVPFRKNKDGFYKLHKIRPKFLRGYKSFLRLLVEFNLTPVHCTMMDRYCSHPFRHNVNKVPDEWDRRAWAYIYTLAFEALRIENKVYGEAYVPRMRGWNEPAHYNLGCERAHAIADAHLFYYEYMRYWYSNMFDIEIPPTHFYVDNSLSEYSKAWFAHKSNCPKCGKEFGGEYLDKKGRMQVVPINHGYSIQEDVETSNGMAFFKSPNYTTHAFGSDGGAATVEKAMGVALLIRNDKVMATDDVREEDNVIYRQGNADQTADLVKKLLTLGHQYRKKEIYYQMAFLETLPDGDEDYDPKLIDWERVRKVGRMFKRIGG